MAYKLAVFEILGDFFVLAYKLCANHASWLRGVYSSFNEHRENTERLRVCTTIRATSLLSG